MTDIFEYKNFRKWLKDWLKEQPKGGRGLLGKWAERLRVHPSLLSQVLADKRPLSTDTALGIAEEMGLKELETEYFLLLVQIDTCQTDKLRRNLQKKIDRMVIDSKKISSRVHSAQEMTAEEKAIFYSTWHYSGIRNLTSVPAYQSVPEIAQRLNMHPDAVKNIIEFLVAGGYCIQQGDRITAGTQKTYVSADSPHVLRHHQNWRTHAMHQAVRRNPEDLFLTMAFSLSEADAGKLRKLLPQWFQEVSRIVDPSPSETVRCLNIDYFEY